MRYVDEYRDPDRVMQLVETLKARATQLNYTASHPCASWKFAAAIPTPFLNSASIGCCRKTSSLSTAPAARFACCRWGESTAALR